MSKSTHPSYLSSTTLPYYNIIFLKKKNYLYFRTNLKNSEKELDERWEQGTAHTKFHADTASLPRTGDHLMKCISPSLWGMAEAAVQSHMLCSCTAFLTSARSSLHSGSQTHCQDRTHLTSNRPKQESNYVDQALKLIEQTVHIFGNFLLKQLAHSRKLVSIYVSKCQCVLGIKTIG